MLHGSKQSARPRTGQSPHLPRVRVDQYRFASILMDSPMVVLPARSWEAIVATRNGKAETGVLSWPIPNHHRVTQPPNSQEDQSEVIYQPPIPPKGRVHRTKHLDHGGTNLIPQRATFRHFDPCMLLARASADVGFGHGCFGCGFFEGCRQGCSGRYFEAGGGKKGMSVVSVGQWFVALCWCGGGCRG